MLRRFEEARQTLWLQNFALRKERLYGAEVFEDALFRTCSITTCKPHFGDYALDGLAGKFL